jgi:hypothetical protein
MEKFENEKTNKLLSIWLHRFTYNELSFDKKRFFDFILSAIEDNEILTEDILLDAIKCETKWTGQKEITKVVDETLVKYYVIRDFWEYIHVNKIV